MTKKRLWHIIRLWTIGGDLKRAEYLKKKKIFSFIGNNVRIMDRKIPLYSNLIKFHNNIQVASNVTFLTHDAIHSIISSIEFGRNVQEKIGCIEIMDNVFIGSNSTILYNVRIGPNAIVAAGSIVNKDVPKNTVVAGVPAKVICTFDEFIEKRLKALYPNDYKIKNQVINENLENFIWDQFNKEKLEK